MVYLFNYIPFIEILNRKNYYINNNNNKWQQQDEKLKSEQESE